MELEKIDNSTDIHTFNFNGEPLRAVLIDGEPWFIALDAAKSLSYSDTYEMTKRLDKDEIQNRQIAGFGNRGVNIINESGLYEAIFNSRKPEAKTFKHWVKNEVLPAIRKTGSYGGQIQLSGEELMAKALIHAQEVMAKKDSVIENQAQQIEAARPKVEVYDKVLTTDHTFGFRDLCKSIRETIPVKETDVKQALRDKGIVTTGNRLDVYSSAIDDGWAVRKPVGKRNGKERFQARFTTKTLEWLLEELDFLIDCV